LDGQFFTGALATEQLLRYITDKLHELCMHN